MSQITLRPRKNAIFEFNSGSWSDVDEEVSDEFSTYIAFNSPVTTDKKALFRFSLPEFSGPISSIVVYARAKITSTAISMRFAIKTYGNYYYGSYFVPSGVFTNYSQTWSTNPYTGNAWTLPEIVDLWAGITGWNGISDSYYLHVTQVYVEVNYTDSGALNTLILRPNGNGDVQELGASSGQNYQCVDEETANGDTDYVAVNTDFMYETDTYTLETGSAPNIAYVVVYATTKLNAMAGSFKLVLRTNSTTYYGPLTSAPAAYAEFYEAWGLNPSTNNQWTQNDIDNLQAGIYLGNGGNATYSPRCTQVYVEVYYKISLASKPQIIGLC